MAQRSFFLYDTLWYVVRMILVVFYRARFYDEHYIPRTGPALLLANHQSHYDPPCIGAASRRRLSFVARKTLFHPPLSWLITRLHAFPIDQVGSSLSGIKETLRRLRDGEAVAMYPEGSRTWDGEMQPLMPGFTALARRAKVPLVPIGISGAYEAFPRGTRFPKLFGAIHIVFGPPLSPEAAARLSDAELIAEIDQRIRTCFERARQQRRRAIRGI